MRRYALYEEVLRNEEPDTSPKRIYGFIADIEQRRPVETRKRHLEKLTYTTTDGMWITELNEERCQ